MAHSLALYQKTYLLRTANYHLGRNDWREHALHLFYRPCLCRCLRHRFSYHPYRLCL